jgi:ATP-dependent exoDNAse (exonuclease V) alpha subunit
VQILPKEELNTGMLLWADQILTATNAKRLSINAQVRALLGRGPEPEDGDKIICLRNYWDDFNMHGDPLVNGTIGILTNCFRTWREIPKFVKSDIRKFDIIYGNFTTDEGVYEMTEIDRMMLMTGMKCCDWRLSYKLGRLKPKYGEIVPKEFAYGYAITCHKAQGSEWDKVLVLEESFPFDKVEHARWLYTACTRASDKLVLVR